MESAAHNHTTLTWVLASLIGVGLAGGFYWKNNHTWANRYDQVERQADSLLSVRLQLEGDNRSLHHQLETAVDENRYLDKRIGSLHDQLTQRDQFIINLRQNDTNQTQTIQRVNQRLNRLQTVRDSLQNQMEAMRDKINWLTDANNLLIHQNKELEQNVKHLTATLLTKVPRSIVTADAFRVEAAKTNGKETAKAKKVATLTISLHIPTELKLDGTQEVYLSLMNDGQHALIKPTRTVTVTLPTMNEVIPVHAEQTVNFDRKRQRISFQLSPKTTIKPGIYRASVYTKDAYLGSVECRFRDSFWFF